MSDAGQPTVTVTLPVSDWQLVMQILQQALLPYQRLGLVMQDMQRQSLQQQSREQELYMPGGKPRPAA